MHSNSVLKFQFPPVEGEGTYFPTVFSAINVRALKFLPISCIKKSLLIEFESYWLIRFNIILCIFGCISFSFFVVVNSQYPLQSFLLGFFFFLSICRNFLCIRNSNTLSMCYRYSPHSNIPPLTLLRLSCVTWCIQPQLTATLPYAPGTGCSSGFCNGLYYLPSGAEGHICYSSGPFCSSSMEMFS